MFAYIPARGGSKRIPKKNIKKLGDKELILHTIDQLLEVSNLTGICVSTDDEEILAVVSKRKEVVTLNKRKASLANDTTSFADLINHDMERYFKHFNTDDVLFTLPTAALVSSNEYMSGIAKYYQDENPAGLVISVTQFNMSPFLALTEKNPGELKALFPDKYLLPTKDLSPCYMDSGCFYIFNRSEFLKHEKLIDLRPIKYVILPSNIGIDVDTEHDWSKLEKEYLKKH